MEYEVQRELNIDGRNYKAGDTLKADQHREPSLNAAAAAGWIQPAPAKEPAKEPAKVTKKTKTKTTKKEE